MREIGRAFKKHVTAGSLLRDEWQEIVYEWKSISKLPNNQRTRL